MYLLLLDQMNVITPLALFNTLEEGRDFLAEVPGYYYEEGVFESYPYTYEIIDVKNFPDYVEIPYKGNLLPMSKFMFHSEEEVDIYWKTIPFLDEKGQGLVEGETRVDAYFLNNTEVKEYIRRREDGYVRVKSILESLDYSVWRDFRGSEDGEAILYQKENEEDPHILLYLDPDFLGVVELEDEKLREWIRAELNQWRHERVAFRE